jgi:hypothetical protein
LYLCVFAKAYGSLSQLPTDLGEDMTIIAYLEESEDEHADGLGKVLMHLWRRENSQNKALLRSIIERWARPLFGSLTSYKQLAEVEAQNADRIMERNRRLYVFTIFCFVCTEPHLSQF